MANPVYIKGYDPDMRLDIEYYPFGHKRNTSHMDMTMCSGLTA